MRPVPRREGRVLVMPPMATTSTPSASRSRPRHSARVCSATRSLSPRRARPSGAGSPHHWAGVGRAGQPGVAAAVDRISRRACLVALAVEVVVGEVLGRPWVAMLLPSPPAVDGRPAGDDDGEQVQGPGRRAPLVDGVRPNGRAPPRRRPHRRVAPAHVRHPQGPRRGAPDAAVAVAASTSPAPVRSCTSRQRHRHGDAAALPAAPLRALAVRVHVGRSAAHLSHGLHPALPGRAQVRAPRSLSFGAGADNGPIAASSTAACSGVITSWYSVTAPDAIHGCDNRATDRQPCLQVVELPPRRTSPASPGAAGASDPHPSAVPSSSNARGHRRHRAPSPAAAPAGPPPPAPTTPPLDGVTVASLHPPPAPSPTQRPGPARPRRPAPAPHADLDPPTRPSVASAGDLARARP